MTENTDNKQMPLGEFTIRATLWGLVGTIGGLRGSRLALWAFLGPVGEKVLGFTLEDIGVAMEREHREKERQERLAQINAALQSIKLQPTNTTQTSEPLSPSQSQLAALAVPSLQLEKDSKWREVIRHPSIVLILGRRGSGKSGLGYRLLEVFRYQLTPYVLDIPTQAEKLLPEWIGITQALDDIPHGSIALIDEAYLKYHSRESLKAQSREMSRIVNLSRQKAQTLIFVTQEARQIDKNIASSANSVIFKELSMLQLKFDRPELNDITMQAKQAFASLSGDKKKFAFVYSPDADFIGLMENSLPTFWSPRLSRAFATGQLVSSNRSAKKLTKEAKIAKAKEMRRQGFSYRKIADILGVSVSTAYNWISDYPYNA